MTGTGRPASGARTPLGLLPSPSPSPSPKPIPLEPNVNGQLKRAVTTRKRANPPVGAARTASMLIGSCAPIRSLCAHRSTGSA